MAGTKPFVPKYKPTRFSLPILPPPTLGENGFRAVLSHQQDGIARGTAVLVSLANKIRQRTHYQRQAAAMYSFSKGSSRQDYPSSLMGTIALCDKPTTMQQWYAQNNPSRKEYNLSLAAFNENI